MYTKPPLRARFEDEQGCLIWDELAMVRLDQRWQRAREIVFRGDVCRQNGAFAVTSQSRSQLRFIGSGLTPPRTLRNPLGRSREGS